jgi:hypothetical protein
VLACYMAAPLFVFVSGPAMLLLVRLKGRTQRGRFQLRVTESPIFCRTKQDALSGRQNVRSECERARWKHESKKRPVFEFFVISTLKTANNSTSQILR